MAATMKKLVPLALLASLTLAVAGCGNGAAGAKKHARSSPPPAPVPTMTASRASVAPTLTLAGIVAPYQNVAITASLSEPTLAVNVNEGDRVHAGEVLAVLDTSDLQANLAAQQQLTKSDDARVAQSQYTATLAFGQNPDAVRQAGASVTQARQTLSQASSDLARDRQLVNNGYISQQQFLQQQTTVANDAAAVRSAQAALSSAQTNQQVNGSSDSSGLQAANIASAKSSAASARAQEQQIEAQIARATIVSPVDGVVVNRNLNPGEYPGGRTLFTVQELSKVYAILNASSSDVFAIREGAQATVRAGDDRSGESYPATIVAVLGQVQPGSTNFTVKALLQNPGLRLHAGIPVTASVDLPTVSGVGVPSGAFLDDSHTTLLTASGGTAHVAHVTDLGAKGGISIVSGIAAGTVVIANGQLGIADGQRLAGDAAPGAAGRHHRPKPDAS